MSEDSSAHPHPLFVSHLLLRGAYHMVAGIGKCVCKVPLKEILNNEDHLAKVGSRLTRHGCPQMPPSKIRERLVYLGKQWDRISALKELPGAQFSESNKIIKIRSTHYAHHIKANPEDAEFLNKEIHNYSWMSLLFGDQARKNQKTVADRRGKSAGSSRSVRKKYSVSSTAPRSLKLGKDDDSEDDFVSGSLKPWINVPQGKKKPDNADSEDDFMPGSLKPWINVPQSKKIQDDPDSEDDFVPGSLKPWINFPPASSGKDADSDDDFM